MKATAVAEGTQLAALRFKEFKRIEILKQLHESNETLLQTTLPWNYLREIILQKRRST